MAKTEKLAFALFVFLLIAGLSAKFYKLKEEPLSQKFVPRTGWKERASKAKDSASKKNPEPLGILDLNTASAEQLEKLPFIGKPAALKIVAYRSSHGPFKDKTDLLRVDGISISLYKKIESSLELR